MLTNARIVWGYSAMFVSCGCLEIASVWELCTTRATLTSALAAMIAFSRMMRYSATFACYACLEIASMPELYSTKVKPIGAHAALIAHIRSVSMKIALYAGCAATSNANTRRGRVQQQDVAILSNVLAYRNLSIPGFCHRRKKKFLFILANIVDIHAVVIAARR